MLVAMGDGVYKSDNSQLEASSLGLGYRRSKNIDDIIGRDHFLKWGSTVMGVADGEWIKVELQVEDMRAYIRAPLKPTPPCSPPLAGRHVVRRVRAP